MVKLMKLPGMDKYIGDQCMYQKDEDKIKDKLQTGVVGFIKKPTGWATNCPEIGKELSARCDGSHDHIKTLAGQVKHAEIY